MNELDQILKSSVDDNKVPFIVAMTGNSTSMTYSGASGDAAPGRAADENTVFRIFSMTKAIGSLAAMILIDRGRLTMDTPVSEVLPEWNQLQVLDGFDGDEPRLRKPVSQATVRHLATHTSGLEYEFWNADMAKYLEVSGHPNILSGLNQALNYPLTTDPGTRWGYGPSIDWLGKMVEAIDGRRIDVFCHEDIFEPLGMSSSAFEADGLEDRLSEVSLRGENGEFGAMELAPPSRPEFYGMGHAMYSSAPDYMQFLKLILNRGELDGQRLLSERSFDQMLADQMQGLTFQTMKSCSPLTADVVLPGDPVHSFAFTTNREPIPGKRSAGSQSWAGVCNTHYWVDRNKDVAAVLMTQSLPFVEQPLMDTYDAFERAVYQSI
ncbi:MAG: serine hydrolase domain-containing protein [Granulosicoccus sp.]